MHCHQAGQALFVIACVMVFLAVCHTVIVSRGLRLGLDLALTALAVLALWVPGNLIPLCMMPDMRCRMIMKPGSMVFAVLIIIGAAADAAAGRRQR